MANQKNTQFTFKVGGQAGQGIKSAGLMFAKLATRSGYSFYDYTEYPSLIKGGHNVMQVTFDVADVTSPAKTTDFLLALNQETIDFHTSELTSGAGVLYDADDNLNLSKVANGTQLFPIPLFKLAKESGGKELLSNVVALGAVVALLGGNLSILKDLIKDEFSGKGDEIVNINLKAAESGYNFASANFADKIKPTLKPVDSIGSIVPKIVISGNEAVALGAIAAGMKFTAIYPMSPISGILQVLAAHQDEFGYVYKQPEDEISAINMAIGASYAGVRAMTASSGGGFCLMTEGYGLAGMTETPLVIIEGMRGGPATGLPTWSEQGDLRFILHAHQGEFPKIVLAAGDNKEAFDLTMEAFNLADKYQTPVVLLIDKNICENDQSFPMFDISGYKISRGKFSTEKIENYERFFAEADGVSIRSIPGAGNFFIANSDEHTIEGYSSEEIADRLAQMDKRMRKLDTCAKDDMPKPKLYGPEDAELTVVSWGSNKGAILEALKSYKNVNFLHLTWMSPFPSEAIKTQLSKAKRILNIESNFSGQLAGLIKEKTGIDIQHKLLKYDGRPIYVDEISSKIDEVLK